MWSFARPTTSTVDAERTPIKGECPECGTENLSSYAVVSEGGWWRVVKCANCLASVDRVRGPRLGNYTPRGLQE